MRKTWWILLLILIGIAVLVSCGKKKENYTELGELVRVETGRDFSVSFFIL